MRPKKRKSPQRGKRKANGTDCDDNRKRQRVAMRSNSTRRQSIVNLKRLSIDHTKQQSIEMKIVNDVDDVATKYPNIDTYHPNANHEKQQNINDTKHVSVDNENNQTVDCRMQREPLWDVFSKTIQVSNSDSDVIITKNTSKVKKSYGGKHGLKRRVRSVSVKNICSPFARTKSSPVSKASTHKFLKGFTELSRPYAQHISSSSQSKGGDKGSSTEQLRKCNYKTALKNGRILRSSESDLTDIDKGNECSDEQIGQDKPNNNNGQLKNLLSDCVEETREKISRECQVSLKKEPFRRSRKTISKMTRRCVILPHHESDEAASEEEEENSKIVEQDDNSTLIDKELPVSTVNTLAKEIRMKAFDLSVTDSVVKEKRDEGMKSESSIRCMSYTDFVKSFKKELSPTISKAAAFSEKKVAMNSCVKKNRLTAVVLLERLDMSKSWHTIVNADVSNDEQAVKKCTPFASKHESNIKQNSEKEFGQNAKKVKNTFNQNGLRLEDVPGKLNEIVKNNSEIQQTRSSPFMKGEQLTPKTSQHCKDTANTVESVNSKSGKLDEVTYSKSQQVEKLKQNGVDQLLTDHERKVNPIVRRKKYPESEIFMKLNADLTNETHLEQKIDKVVCIKDKLPEQETYAEVKKTRKCNVKENLSLDEEVSEKQCSATATADKWAEKTKEQKKYQVNCIKDEPSKQETNGEVNKTRKHNVKENLSLDEGVSEKQCSTTAGKWAEKTKEQKRDEAICIKAKPRKQETNIGVKKTQKRNLTENLSPYGRVREKQCSATAGKWAEKPIQSSTPKAGKTVALCDWKLDRKLIHLPNRNADGLGKDSCVSKAINKTNCSLTPNPVDGTDSSASKEIGKANHLHTSKSINKPISSSTQKTVEKVIPSSNKTKTKPVCTASRTSFDTAISSLTTKTKGRPKSMSSGKIAGHHKTNSNQVEDSVNTVLHMPKSNSANFESRILTLIDSFDNDSVDCVCKSLDSFSDQDIKDWTKALMSLNLTDDGEPFSLHSLQAAEIPCLKEDLLMSAMESVRQKLQDVGLNFADLPKYINVNEMWRVAQENENSTLEVGTFENNVSIKCFK